MIISLLLFLLILSLLVLIHEAGHFFVAKKFGIKVEEFGYGLPPRAWGKKIGETLYSINWLPFGGFVKLYGEDEAGAGSVKVPKKELPKTDIDRAFFSRPVSQRAAVVVAGVVMNALLAAAIYYVYFGITDFKAEIPYMAEHNFLLAEKQNVLKGVVVREVLPDSPASKAGLKNCSEKACQKIIAINNQPLTGSTQFTGLIKENRGKPTTFIIQDLTTQKKETVTMTPRVNPPKNQGALGIGFVIEEAIMLSYKTPIQKLLSGFVHPINIMTYQFAVLGKIINISIENNDVQQIGGAVSGPVGIFKVLDMFMQIPDAKERFLQILNLAGLLSASLAFFNVLPIPALDGGRLFFILVEGITRKKVSPRFESMVHTVGMAVLLTFILLVTFKDIFQLFR